MLSRLKNGFAPRAGSLFTLREGAVTPLAGSGAGDILLVPAEQLLTLSVALPLPSHRKRFEALPFAIEDRIATPVDAAHLALGTTPIAGAYLASVVDPALMAHWTALASANDLDQAAIMPDALALPIPADGRWTVLREPGARIMVRFPDGRGFAAQEEGFLSLWAIAGKPPCDEVRHFPDPVSLAIDLRQGDYAAAGGSLAVPLRRAAAIAAIGLLAHGAIAAADVILLRSVAAKRGLEMQAQLAQVSPDLARGNSPSEAAAIVAAMLPAGSASPPGALIPLLAKVSTALDPLRDRLRYRAIAVGEDGALRFDFETPDPATIEAARRALTQAGFAARIDGAGIVIGAEAPRG